MTYWDNRAVSKTSTPYHVYNEKDGRNGCQFWCKLDDNCKAASFNNDTKTCSRFNTHVKVQKSGTLNGRTWNKWPK